MEREDILRAGDRNVAATLLHYARTSPDARSEYDERLVLVSLSRTWPAPYHNGAIRLDPSMPPGEVLARAEAFFSERCPGYCLWIAAHADADLERDALTSGYAKVSDAGTPRLVLERRIGLGVPPRGITLEEVRDDASRRDFLTVTIDAFRDSPLPPRAAEEQLATVESLHADHVRAVVAREAGRPLSAAMTVVSDKVAGIQMVGTVGGERGRGLGELCTRWAAHTGFELGAEAVVLEASEEGEPLYLGLGFVEMSRYRWCFGPGR